MTMNSVMIAIADHIFGMIIGVILSVCIILRCIPEIVKTLVKYTVYGFREGVQLTEEKDIMKFSDIDIGGLF